MAWVDLSSAFGFGAVLTSAQMQNLRDNIAAAFAKDTGAPELASNYIENAMVAAGVLGSEKFQSGTTERDWVLARSAAASAGAAGTYALLVEATRTATRTAGSTVAGSAMRYANATGSSSGTPGGTWRIMGYIFDSSTAELRTTVCLRIS